MDKFVLGLIAKASATTDGYAAAFVFLAFFTAFTFSVGYVTGHALGFAPLTCGAITAVIALLYSMIYVVIVTEK